MGGMAGRCPSQPHGHGVGMPPSLRHQTYEEAVAEDARLLQQTIGMTHQQFVDALQRSIKAQVAAVQILCREQGVPWPWPQGQV